MTLAEILAYVSDGERIDVVFRSPFDTFAFVGSVIEDSGWYRTVVDPDDGVWPGNQWADFDAWRDHVEDTADEWLDYVRRGLDSGRTLPLPPSLRAYRETVRENLGRRIADTVKLELKQDLITLVAICDECAWNVGMPGGRRKDDRSGNARVIAMFGEMLRDKRTLSNFPPERVRVLPKVRVPQTGITFRSITHNVALIRVESDTVWETPVIGSWRRSDRQAAVLVLPWPLQVEEDWFEERRTHQLPGMDAAAFGFFDYAPTGWFDQAAVRSVLENALQRSSQIDLVVFPELALTEAELAVVETCVDELMDPPPVVITGLSRPSSDADSWQTNDVVVSWLDEFTGERERVCQPKHHRWLLDGEQVRTYGLCRRLDDRRGWWEGARVPARELNFLAFNDDTVVCPLVCEDLARQEPMGRVVRSIGPSLVVALLLDGPQLSNRWAARYASVLAEDPGSSVLTVSAAGMVMRSCPAGYPPPKPIVAAWKDSETGFTELSLGTDEHGTLIHRGVLLQLETRRKREWTADGRDDGGNAPVLKLSNWWQIE